VGVLAAEDRVDLDDLLLPLERLEVVRDAEEVDLGREFVGGVIPSCPLFTNAAIRDWTSAK
jgi:hypothetical protein